MRIGHIIHGKRPVTAELALQLGRYFGQSPRYWLNLQSRYDMDIAEDALGEWVVREVCPFKSELATKESISINQFITTAVAEKMAALLTEEYLEERARQADPAAFDRIWARMLDVPPVPGDEPEPPSVSRAANCSLPALRMTRADSPTSVMSLYAGSLY